MASCEGLWSWLWKRVSPHIPSMFQNADKIADTSKSFAESQWVTTAKQEQKMRSQGKHAVADEIAECMKPTKKHAVDGVMRARKHVFQLTQMTQSGTHHDALLASIKSHNQKLVKEISMLCEEVVLCMGEVAGKRQKYELAKQIVPRKHGANIALAGGLCCVGGACLMLNQAAWATASIPLIGKIFTGTSSVMKTHKGWLGAKSATQTQSAVYIPLSRESLLGLGCSCTVAGLARHAARKPHELTEEDSRELLNTLDNVSKMIQFCQNLWRDLEILSAEIGRLSEQSMSQVHQRLEGCLDQIDTFIVGLSVANQSPSNFNVIVNLGELRHDNMKASILAELKKLG